ncbi:MAG: hypothetical protein ACI4MC_03345, partial [Candidatus Coproplasma sp.]
WLYYDAKSMTSNEIFNKYKLNEALRSYTKEQNDRLFKVVFSSFGGSRCEEDEEAVRIIIDGALEKLCADRTAPDRVLDYLVKTLW